MYEKLTIKKTPEEAETACAATDRSGGSGLRQRSAQGGGAAAARRGNSGVDGLILTLGNALRRSADQQRNMESMAEGGGHGLRKGRAQRAQTVRGADRVTELNALNAGEMAEFVNDGALLRRNQQQHEAQ
jgi:hypothetical protein